LLNGKLLSGRGACHLWNQEVSVEVMSWGDVVMDVSGNCNDCM